MKIKLPTDDDLLVQITALDSRISHALTSRSKTAKVTVRDKLRLLNDQLLRFKDSGISYKIIREILREELQLNVSEQTLREHCQQELNFPKRGAVVTDNRKETVGIQSNMNETGSAQYIANSEHEQASRKTNAQGNSPLSDALSTQLTEQTTTLIKQIEDY